MRVVGGCRLKPAGAGASLLALAVVDEFAFAVFDTEFEAARAVGGVGGRQAVVVVHLLFDFDERRAVVAQQASGGGEIVAVGFEFAVETEVHILFLANVGFIFCALDSRFRGNDGEFQRDLEAWRVGFQGGDTFREAGVFQVEPAHGFPAIEAEPVGAG